MLALLTVCALAAMSVRIADRTAAQVLLLRHDGVGLARLTGGLGELIEQHRRLVESAPDTVGPARLTALDGQLRESEARIMRLVDNPAIRAVPGAAAQLVPIRGLLPGLFDSAHAVVFVAGADASGGALGSLFVAYDLHAARLADLLRRWRLGRDALLDRQVADLTGDGDAIVRWAWACVLASVIVGLLGMSIVRRAIGRLGCVTRALFDLAHGRTDLSLPEIGAADEVGDLSRAAEVFRANALTFQHQRDALRRTNLRFDAALNNMTHGLVMVDADCRIVVSNRKVREIYRLGPSCAAAGASFRDFVGEIVAGGNFPGRSADSIHAERMETIARGKRAITYWPLAGDRTVAIAHEPLPDGGWVATYEDITERRRFEEQIQFLARHDAQTRLANRLLFNERLAQALAELASGERDRFAVLCLDIDQFKAVNDQLGTKVGDRLLGLVADRLRTLPREGETAARLDGDEFAMLALGVERGDEAAVLARRMIDLVIEPYEVDGKAIVIGASVGIALAPADGAAPELLLRNAALALARAKTEHRGGWRFFEPAMDASAQARRALETDLRAALAGSQFEVWYQPLLNTRTRRISGFEALVRWRHPVRGLVSPGEFIPLAEEIGLIVPLGAWVLRRACADATAWPGHIKLAVNLSAVQFRDPELVRRVIDALDDAALPASRLDLEITESVLLQDSDQTLATLHELRGLGVGISMDDFGTGYSSLSYLRSFPFDKIKIDQSFVRDLSEREDSLAIVRAVTGMARSLGITTTAEGVETDAQFARLTAEGCTEVQGFLFSPARPAADVGALLTRLAAEALAA